MQILLEELFYKYNLTSNFEILTRVQCLNICKSFSIYFNLATFYDITFTSDHDLFDSACKMFLVEAWHVRRESLGEPRV